MPRRWNEIDRDEAHPGLSELVAARKSITWAPVPVADPALDRYLEQVAATHVNGGHLLCRWRAVEYSDSVAWFMARSHDFGLLRVFFDDAVVRDGLAELQIPSPLPADFGGFAQEWPGVLCLDGILAGVLVRGGAYEKYRGPAREAKALAAAAVEALTQNRFEDFRLEVSDAPWTRWFYDVAWDHTYVLTDLANAEVTVLCITDTD